MGSAAKGQQKDSRILLDSYLTQQQLLCHNHCILVIQHLSLILSQIAPQYHGHTSSSGQNPTYTHTECKESFRALDEHIRLFKVPWLLTGFTDFTHFL